MKSLLEQAGRTFLVTFASALVAFSFGISAAPNLNRITDVGVSALLASIAAAITAVQVYVPQITFTNLVGKEYGRFLDAFTRGFVGTLLVTLIGILGSPDLHTARAVAVAGIVGALNAGGRAVVALFTPGETPVPKLGLTKA